MLTCRELDAFIDRLCDLTVTMPGMDRIREAGELMELIERIPQRFIMEWRAATAADLHYLDGESLREIARQDGRAHQGVVQWLHDHGPSHYISLIQEDDGSIRAVPFAVTESRETRTKIRQFRAAGRRIVPAVQNILDPTAPDKVRNGTDLQTLWAKLGG